MIPNYSPPSFTISQRLRSPRAGSVSRNAAVVLGVQYMLALNDGRALPESAFDAGGAGFPLRAYIDGVDTDLSDSGYSIDASSVKLIGKDLEATVASGILTLGYVTGRDDALRSSSNNLKGGTLNGGLGGRAVSVGDVVEVEVDDTTAGSFSAADRTFKRKVVALLPKLHDASLTGPAAGPLNFASNAGADIAVVGALPAGYSTPTVAVTSANRFYVVGGRYSAQLGDEFVCTCTTSGAQGVAKFVVSSVASGYSEEVTTGGTGNNYTLALSATLHYNLTITLPKTSTPVVGETVRFGYAPVYTEGLLAALSVNAASNYTGTHDRVYTVEVTVGATSGADAEITVYDSTGIEPVQIYTGDAATVNLGTLGLTLTITGTPVFVKGSRFTVSVNAPVASTSEFNGVVLDGPILDVPTFNTSNGKFRVAIREPFSGELLAVNSPSGLTTPFTALSIDDFEYISGLGKITNAYANPFFAPFADGVGQISVAFRAAVPPAAVEGPIFVSSADEIAALFGEIDINNDLAYGVFRAMSGGDIAGTGSGSPIYAVRVAADNSTAWGTALGKLKSSDVYYALAILSDDLESIQLAAAHCSSQSDKRTKNWRRCYFGTDSPGEYVLWGAQSGGAFRQAQLSGTTVTVREADRAVSDFLVAGARAGDIIRFSVGGDFPVTEVLSNGYQVRVLNVLNTSIPTDTAFSLVKPDTAENTIDFVSEVSRAVGNRRACNVWVDSGTALIGGVPVVVPNKFLAAEIAGARAASAPQQGLTSYEVSTITSAPSMYARFDPTQLNRAAANGTFVVTQDIGGGVVYVRHQLTTDVGNGLLEREDSCGATVDAFCFLKKDALTGVVGRRNRTANTRLMLENRLLIISTEATATSAIDEDDIGPLVVSFADESGNAGQVTVRPDTILADKFVTFVLIRIPVPLNDIDGYVDAEASIIF